MRAISWAISTSLCLLLACGGENKHADAPSAASALPPAEPPPEPTKKEKVEKANEDTPPPNSEKPTTPEEKAEKPQAAPADAGEESTARNVKYVVNPEGMRVEIEGVTFSPKAEIVKMGASYGVKLKVDARAKDGKVHSILAPANAEVAFAGSVKRKDAETEKFGDKREGDREVLLKGEKPAKLSRTWPAPGGLKPLALGDELELMVGIWGLGDDAASRRPLKKFCKVTVKFEKDKPKLSVTPPDGVSK